MLPPYQKKNKTKQSVSADDTNIFLSGCNLKEMTETFNVELAKIHKSLQVNKLSINIDKNKYMIFRSKKKHKAPKVNIAIDGKILKMVKQTKFVGVLMDEFFIWKADINHVANKDFIYFSLIFRRKYFICTKIHNIHISMEINLSKFVVFNIYKYICLVYMHSSYITVYFFDLYIQCALVYNYFTI